MTDDSGQMSSGQLSADSAERLAAQVEGHLKTFRNKERWWRRRAARLYIAAAVLSALITVLAGWQGNPDFSGVISRNNLILLFGGAATVLNAWAAFFNHREQWRTHALAANRLQALRERLRLTESGSLENSVKLSAVAREFEEVLVDAYTRTYEATQADTDES